MTYSQLRRASAVSSVAPPRFQVSSWRLAILLAFALTAGFGLSYLARASLPPGRAIPAAATGQAPAATPGTFMGPKGPWGQLEYTRIVMEPPAEYLPTE